jgi:hypothetical protein
LRFNRAGKGCRSWLKRSRPAADWSVVVLTFDRQAEVLRHVLDDLVTRTVRTDGPAVAPVREGERE